MPARRSAGPSPAGSTRLCPPPPRKASGAKASADASGLWRARTASRGAGRTCRSLGPGRPTRIERRGQGGRQRIQVLRRDAGVGPERRLPEAPEIGRDERDAARLGLQGHQAEPFGLADRARHDRAVDVPFRQLAASLVGANSSAFGTARTAERRARCSLVGCRHGEIRSATANVTPRNSRRPATANRSSTPFLRRSRLGDSTTGWGTTPGGGRRRGRSTAA